LIQTISSKNGFSAFLTCLRKLADFDEGQESLPIELQKIFLTENYLGLRVLQVIKCPIVIANEAKRNEAIARTQRLRDCFVVPPRNDKFWIIYLLEHSYAIVIETSRDAGNSASLATIYRQQKAPGRVTVFPLQALFVLSTYSSHSLIVC
jgi:hypothetical protein